MGQAKSFKKTALDGQMAEIERELTALKAIQQYAPSQINYSYLSNPVDVTSYIYMSGGTHYGINASFIFTSRLQNIYPRTMMQVGPTDGEPNDGVMLSQRSEKISANQVRITVQLVDTMIPMAGPYQFKTRFRVASNVVGTLILESTYVLPSP